MISSNWRVISGKRRRPMLKTLIELLMMHGSVFYGNYPYLE